MPDLDLVKLEECAQRDAQHSESLTAIAPQVVLLLIQRCRAAERHAAAAQPRIRDLKARIAELESAARAISSGRDDLDALEKRFTGVVPPAERETQAIVMPLIALVRSLDAELARHGDEAVTLRRECGCLTDGLVPLTEDRDLLAAIDAAHSGNRPSFSEMALALKREERERAAAVQIAEEARRKRDEAQALARDLLTACQHELTCMACSAGTCADCNACPTLTTIARADVLLRYAVDGPAPGYIDALRAVYDAAVDVERMFPARDDDHIGRVAAGRIHLLRDAVFAAQKAGAR